MMGGMDLPVMPPVAPMLAKAVPEIPDGASYEPKWDGFRSVVFRDGDEVEIGSRNEKPMTRYFPELVEAFRAELPERCVVDGEIVVAVDGRLEFEVLQQRIHPGRLAGAQAVGGDARVVRRVRPAGAGGRGPDRAAVRRTAGAARVGAGRCRGRWST